MSGERAGTHQNEFSHDHLWKVVAIHRGAWEQGESKCHPSIQIGQEGEARNLPASQPDFNALDQLTRIWHSAKTTKVVGLVPYGPITQELELIILEAPFQIRIFCERRMIEHLILGAISVNINDKKVIKSGQQRFTKVKLCSKQGTEIRAQICQKGNLDINKQQGLCHTPHFKKYFKIILEDNC